MPTFPQRRISSTCSFVANVPDLDLVTAHTALRQSRPVHALAWLMRGQSPEPAEGNFIG
jgi:hypothetical protein